MKRYLGHHPERDRTGLLAATDADIENAVYAADPLCLRGLIFWLTGDEEIAATRLEAVPGPIPFPVPTPHDIALIRGKAVKYLKLYRDSGAPDVAPGPADRLAQSLSLAAGKDIPSEEIAFWTEELALDPWARGSNKLVGAMGDLDERVQQFKVLIVGTGISGVGAAVHLKHAGIPFEVLEKNAEVGGTWLVNSYPGVRVDTPSRSYTHLFGRDFHFDHPFSPGGDNLTYLKWAVDHFEIRQNIRFNTEVISATWNETSHMWDVVARTASGKVSISANVLMTGTGILSLPNIPDVPGVDAFGGRSFHTSQWPDDIDIKGKNVGVVGSAATGYQMIPELIKTAKHVTMFQRKPQWIFPVPGYVHQMPEGVLWLDRNLPYHTNFMRFRTAWFITDGFDDCFGSDPSWIDDHSRSALNHAIREDRISFIRKKFASRPELIEKMIPKNPPYSSRPLFVDEDENIYEALLSEKVSLVSAGVEAVTPDGLVSDGKEHPFDVIVWATGFRAHDFLMPMKITGRDGIDIHDFWSKDGARAYAAGSMVPGFPNMFMLLGPNTGPGRGGNLVVIVEMVMKFALECIEKMLTDGKRVIEVTEDAFKRYNARLDELERTRIYTDPRAGGYYTNEHGRAVVHGAVRQAEMWSILRNGAREDVEYR